MPMGAENSALSAEATVRRVSEVVSADEGYERFKLHNEPGAIYHQQTLADS